MTASDSGLSRSSPAEQPVHVTTENTTMPQAFSGYRNTPSTGQSGSRNSEEGEPLLTSNEPGDETYLSNNLDHEAVLDQSLNSHESSRFVGGKSIDRQTTGSRGSTEEIVVSNLGEMEEMDDWIELPTSPCHGCFVLDDKIKCYLGPREHTYSAAHYATARDLVQNCYATCNLKYSRDSRWRQPLREMVEALGLSRDDVMNNAEEMGEDPEYQPTFDQEASGNKKRREAMSAFNEVYDNYFHEAGIKPSRRPGGRKPKMDKAISTTIGHNILDSSIREDAAGVGIKIPTFTNDGLSRKRKSAGWSETADKKRIRPAWKDVWPEAPDPIPDTTKTPKQIANYVMQDKLPTKLQMFMWDMDVFTKYDAKLRHHHIKSVLSAKDSNGNLIVSEERCYKLVNDYDGWKANQQNPIYANRQGNVKMRSQSAFEDVREKHTGKFEHNPSTRQYNTLAYHEALHKAFTNDRGQVFAGPKEKGTKLRPARVNMNFMIARANEKELSAAEASEHCRRTAAAYKTDIADADKEIKQLEEDKQKLADTVRQSVSASKQWKTRCENMEQIVDWHCKREHARLAYISDHYPDFRWPNELADVGNIGNDPRKLPFPVEDFERYLPTKRGKSSAFLESLTALDHKDNSQAATDSSDSIF